jgi:hypothetical protein
VLALPFVLKMSPSSTVGRVAVNLQRLARVYAMNSYSRFIFGELRRSRKRIPAAELGNAAINNYNG